MDGAKFTAAVKENRCWVCGERLGIHLAFLIGPMCGINRTTSEPPCHLECARWSGQNCPFLSRPHMVRREDEFTEEVKSNPSGNVGMPILRNPGVALIWTTRTYKLMRRPHGRYLIEIGEPDSLEWYAAGRLATREEVEHSVNSGFPLLEEADGSDPAAMKELQMRRLWLEARFPAAARQSHE